jgi:hypothetical protein
MRGEKPYAKRVLEPTVDGGPTLTWYDVFIGSRKVGRLSASGRVYYSWRNEEEHFAFVPGGYGIEKDLADHLFKPGSAVEQVVLVITHRDGRKCRYWTTVGAWKQAATFTLSEDFGPQVFLTMETIEREDRDYRKFSQPTLFDHRLQTREDRFMVEPA